MYNMPAPLLRLSRTTETNCTVKLTDFASFVVMGVDSLGAGQDGSRVCLRDCGDNIYGDERRLEKRMEPT